eukprot:5273204-Karenia_brevis.AAC.1
MSGSSRPPPTSGDALAALRHKILAVWDVHSNFSAPEIADLILKGQSPPMVKNKGKKSTKMKRRTLIKQVERTLKSKGQDGRANNGRERWVRTPKFIEG